MSETIGQINTRRIKKQKEIFGKSQNPPEITQQMIDENIELFLEEQDENPRYACDIANAIFSHLYELAYKKS